MKTYEIWMEGYAATGEHGTARFIGTAEGTNFEDACRNFRQPEDIYGPTLNKAKLAIEQVIIVHKGEPLKLDEYDTGPSIWGCRLFDNEADARKSYG